MFNMGNMQNMSKLMKQAQDMQARMERVQQEIAEHQVVGESGAGLVKVTMTGAHEVKRVEIDPSLFGDDKEMCEDLLAAAYNDAHRRVEEYSQERMGELTAGIKLPAGFKLPF